MNKLLTLLLAVVALLNGASAFTVARPMSSSRSMAPMMPNVAPQSVSTTARAMFIDPNIPEIANQPVGSLIMLIAMVSLWEVITPGRAKK